MRNGTPKEMLECAMVLARKGWDHETVMRTMTSWAADAAIKANDWADREDAATAEKLSPWCPLRVLKKGMFFRRKSDGFTFRVESTSHKGTCAFMQCTDATKIFGSYSGEDIALSFDRVLT